MPDRDVRRTTELDPDEIQKMLEEPPPTVVIARDELLGLIDASCETDAGAIHANTVPRDRVRVPVRIAHGSSQQLPVDAFDTDLRPSVSPYAVLGVIGLLVVLFIAIVQL